MTVATTAGSTLRISASQPSAMTVAAYNTLFTTAPIPPLIGEITNLGEFGREYVDVTHKPVASRGTQHFKGSFDEGKMDLDLALDGTDNGQVLALAASLSDADYSFMLTTQNGSKMYFQAKVMTFKVGVGSVDDITKAKISLQLTTDSNGAGIQYDLV